MEDLRGKWTLITGASRGIGRLCAMELARRGSNLILHSRSAAHLVDVANEVRAMGVLVETVGADLANDSDVRIMLQSIDGAGYDVDYVLNNAGIQVTYRTDYYSTPVEDFDISLRVNTVAPLRICYHYLPKMIAKGYGRIVNVTSGIDKEPEQAAYSASKAALDKTTKDLATKIDGTNVMLNLVDPGWCRTDLGGPNAPNAPESAVTGCILGLFASDKKSGRIFRAQDYAGMTVEEAVKKL